ncbi:MAG: polyprenyl synthetase family protein [Candidatus Kariarchaeaceae archaeon]
MDFKTEIANRGKIAVDHLVESINRLVHPEDPLREAVLHYPVNGGGKGFRPAMLQLVTGALLGDEKRAIPAAAAIEAVHVSSLIHDDFMDTDETRRGVPAVWTKWDPTIAILAGDALVGVGFSLAGEIEGVSYEMKYHFTKNLAKVYVQLCHGQMLDIGFEDRPFDNLTLDELKGMQYLKTGVLFEFACVTGARLALNKIEDPLIEKVREYAKLAGTAFQIQDDIIGIIGDEAEVGKPIGSDIIEGKRTMIAVHAVNNANEEQLVRLKTALGNHDATPQQIEACKNAMQEIGSIEYASNLALEMANQAVEITKELPQNSNTEILREFALYMISRTY